MTGQIQNLCRGAIMKKLCEISNCRNVSCGKKILIADFGRDRQWLAEVCQDHYDNAHPSRKPKEEVRK